MRKGRIVIIISLLLMALSAQPLYLMGQEVLIQQKVRYQYEIENIYHPIDMTTDPFKKLLTLEDGQMRPFPEMKREVAVNGKEVSDYREFIDEVHISKENELTRVISFYQTEISIVDTFTGTEDADFREKAPVEIRIQGTNYAEPINVEIRPTYLDNNRYHGYVGMLKMSDTSANEENFVLIQRLFEDSYTISEKDFKWKVIFINKEGKVETEIFTREDIDSPAYRKDLINIAHVSPYALGYKSNLLHGYPSLFYPFLYPFGTAGLGIILLFIGLVLRKREKKKG